VVALMWSALLAETICGARASGGVAARHLPGRVLLASLGGSCGPPGTGHSGLGRPDFLLPELVCSCGELLKVVQQCPHKRNGMRRI